MAPRTVSRPDFDQQRGPGASRTIAALRGVTKTYGGTVAVKDVSLELKTGEVLALLGENGAGKSTCVKIFGGVCLPDSGEVLINDRPVRLNSPMDALAHGVAVMHQHPVLFGDLTVAENVFVGQMPSRPMGPGRRSADERRSPRVARSGRFVVQTGPSSKASAQLRAAAG